MVDKERTRSYQPYTEARLYPGVKVSPERRKALTDLEMANPEEFTLDDIGFLAGTNWTRIAYGFIAMLEDEFGKDRARQLVATMAYKGGRRRIEAWLQRNQAEELTPELMVRFQDHSHLSQGPDHACSFMAYVPNGCVLRRTACGWHDGRPEGMESYCKQTSDAFFQAYKDVQPRLSIEIPRCRSRGTSEEGCEIRYLWRDGTRHSDGSKESEDG